MSTTFTYNNRYLMKDGTPWFPIMGEFHYSRFNHSRWYESLQKMKATGVSVVSTYTFWIHHEEIEGQYDFEGNKNLRKFVKTVKDSGLKMFLRIGPWCHGEVRNGGFPDWIMERDYEARTNNEAYFEDVKKFYEIIYSQVDGYFHHQGGPIIGLQIENEYGHCGGLTGQEGENHMIRLTEMAKEIGYDVPYYTATGWGGAVTGGLIPVMGGYCDAPWDPRLTQIEPSGNYIFTHERNDHNIGSDYGFGEGITFDMDKFPFLTAELGGGLQVTYHRRPIATGKDISAMSLAKLGSGVNLLGYYMYHGGTNPKGINTSLQETKETGYPNDYQVFNYDFQAAIRQDGQVSETGKELKLWAYFAKDFGERFCEMPAEIPEENPLYPTDNTSLRFSIRRNENEGFLFINNYQKNQIMANHKNIDIECQLESQTIVYKNMNIKNGDFVFYPLNMPLVHGRLIKAKATPLCKLNNEEVKYVFYGDGISNYEFEDEKDQEYILHLSREEALNAWKVTMDKEYLIMHENVVYQEEDQVVLLTRNCKDFLSYPKLLATPTGYMVEEGLNGFFYYKCMNDDKKIGEKERVDLQGDNICEIATMSPTEYTIHVNYQDETEAPSNINDYFLLIDYLGDGAKLYVDDELVADHFYYGKKWEVGLRNLGYPREMKLVLDPILKDAPIYLEVEPTFIHGQALAMNEVFVEKEEKLIIQTKSGKESTND